MFDWTFLLLQHENRMREGVTTCRGTMREDRQETEQQVNRDRPEDISRRPDGPNRPLGWVSSHLKKRGWLALALVVALTAGIGAIWFATHRERKVTQVLARPTPTVTADSTPRPTMAPPDPTPTLVPTATPSTSGDAETAFNRGYAAYANREDEYSISDYTEAIRLKPDYADAYNNRGLVYDHANEYARAIKDYTEAIRLNPNDARYRNNRGFAYDDNKEYQKAIDDYSEAIRLDPEYSLAYLNRGVSYFHLGAYDRAIDDYTVAIQRQPRNAEAYYNRGLAYKNQGKPDRAKDDFAQADRLRRSGQ
jgi:tetratricopeptide (TPR) repeat protein